MNVKQESLPIISATFFISETEVILLIYEGTREANAASRDNFPVLATICRSNVPIASCRFLFRFSNN